MRRAAALAAILTLAGCVHPGVRERPLQPSRADLESALMPLDLCAGDDSGTCDSAPMPQRIQILASRCQPLAPRGADPTAVCRVRWREHYGYAPMDRTHHGCVVLHQVEHASGPGRYWAWDWWTTKDAAILRMCRDAGFG